MFTHSVLSAHNYLVIMRSTGYVLSDWSHRPRKVF